MAKLSTDELLDAFKDMTLLELSEFVKKFEDTFEVTAAAPGAVAATGPAAAAAPAARAKDKSNRGPVGPRRRGAKGEGKVQGRPGGRRGQEDPVLKGRPRAGLGSGPQGGQGP